MLPCRFAKGVLSGVVPWREARRFFAWRLKRRLTEEGLIRHISSTDVSISRLDAIAMVSCAHGGMPLHLCTGLLLLAYSCGQKTPTGSRSAQPAFSGFASFAHRAAVCLTFFLLLLCCLQVRAWSSQAGTGLHDELALSSQAGSDDVAPHRPSSSSGGAPAVATAAAAAAAAAAAGDVAKLWEAMLESDK
jgi:hypothetical protein